MTIVIDDAYRHALYMCKLTYKHTHYICYLSTYMYTVAFSLSLSHTHTTGPPQSPAPTDPTLHKPSAELLSNLKDVYVESTTDIVTVRQMKKCCL